MADDDDEPITITRAELTRLRNSANIAGLLAAAAALEAFADGLESVEIPNLSEEAETGAREAFRYSRSLARQLAGELRKEEQAGEQEGDGWDGNGAEEE